MNFPNHLNYGILNTPIITFKKYFNEISKYKIWMKRDDLTGLELSGNKVRKLDFLLAEALNSGAKRVITCGGLQSNHCRTTAFYATKLGLKTTLVLRGELPENLEGNFFLNQVLDVDFQFVNAEQYQDVDQFMAGIASDSSEKCFVIPEGGSNEIGAWGYTRCFVEIVAQMKSINKSVDTIVVATGSGGTHAGLLIGKLLLKSHINILSINVCDDADFFKQKICNIIERFNRRYNYKLECGFDDVSIIDGFVGEGYGKIGKDEVDVINRLAKTEGIIIDPVYGAKALRGFEENLFRENIPGENIVFIHTGGIFGLFPYSTFFKTTQSLNNKI